MSKKNRQNQEAGAQQAGQGGKDGGRFADYFWANLIFFAFLAVLSYVVWASCSSPTDDAAVQMVLKDTFKFMILLFGGGFLVVTLFDAAYEFFAEKAEDPGAE
jgi:hypothetical protein